MSASLPESWGDFRLLPTHKLHSPRNCCSSSSRQLWPRVTPVSRWVGTGPLENPAWPSRVSASTETQPCPLHRGLGSGDFILAFHIPEFLAKHGRPYPASGPLHVLCSPTQNAPLLLSLADTAWHSGKGDWRTNLDFYSGSVTTKLCDFGLVIVPLSHFVSKWVS